MLKKEDVGGLIILFSVLAVFALFFLFAPKAPEVTYKPVELDGSSLEVIPNMERLNEVKVNATLVKGGFVVIHEALGVTAPGPVVGPSDYLEPGTYSEMRITLPRDLEEDQDYFALLFVDDGDEVYEPGIDLPVKSYGEVMKKPFITPTVPTTSL